MSLMLVSARIGLIVLLLAQLLMLAQTPTWQAGIAKVSVNPDLRRQPGTAFVVALRNNRAFLLTAAHVVEGDPNPHVEFVAEPDRAFEATVQNQEAGEERGLALLVVAAPPPGITVLHPDPSRPSLGERVIVAGFPGSLGSLSVIDPTISTLQGRDVALSHQTEPGFSGGPVIRNSEVIGLVYGTNAGGFGMAVRAASMSVYLDGNGVAWGGDVAVTEARTPAKPAGPRPGEVRINSVDGLPYVWIPQGQFRMGCSPDDNECQADEKPSHMLRISKGFWLGQTEVTQAAFQKVMGKNPSPFKGAELPVENVTWNEAREYCEAVKGRLPTEAQWEYAARAGSTQARYGELDAIAWYRDNSGGRTHEVMTKQPNAWRLFDMLGNLREWTSDWYARDYYQSSPSFDPEGPGGGKYRVARGGSWDAKSAPRNVRASARYGLVPEVRSANFGFRCARE